MNTAPLPASFHIQAERAGVVFSLKNLRWFQKEAMCRKLHTLRGLNGRSDLIRSSEAATLALKLLLSLLQIAILFCRTVRVKTCMLLSVVDVRDRVKELNVCWKNVGTEEAKGSEFFMV